MKIIALGDTHGRDYWKQIVNTQTFDKIVFIGDYFDSFDIDGQVQINNFLDIIEFKKANPEKVVLLVGNHDFHYMPIATSIGEYYSGFQSSLSHQISYLLQEHKSYLQMAYKYNNFLFTHAGVTNTWLKQTMGLHKTDETDFLGIPVDEYINDVWKYSPKHFYFNGRDPYGDDVTQSPIWVRPDSLNEDAFAATHVVGHTRQERIGKEATRFLNGGEGFFIDTLGSSKEYLLIDGFDVMPQSEQNAQECDATGDASST
jgi:predicted phosphodiesterase